MACRVYTVAVIEQPTSQQIVLLTNGDPDTVSHCGRQQFIVPANPPLPPTDRVGVRRTSPRLSSRDHLGGVQ